MTSFLFGIMVALFCVIVFVFRGEITQDFSDLKERFLKVGQDRKHEIASLKEAQSSARREVQALRDKAVHDRQVTIWMDKFVNIYLPAAFKLARKRMPKNGPILTEWRGSTQTLTLVVGDLVLNLVLDGEYTLKIERPDSDRETMHVDVGHDGRKEVSADILLILAHHIGSPALDRVDDPSFKRVVSVPV